MAISLGKSGTLNCQPEGDQIYISLVAIVVILAVWPTIEGDQIYLNLLAIVVILAVWPTIEGARFT